MDSCLSVFTIHQRTFSLLHSLKTKLSLTKEPLRATRSSLRRNQDILSIVASIPNTLHAYDLCTSLSLSLPRGIRGGWVLASRLFLTEFNEAGEGILVDGKAGSVVEERESPLLYTAARSGEWQAEELTHSSPLSSHPVALGEDHKTENKEGHGRREEPSEGAGGGEEGRQGREREPERERLCLCVPLARGGDAFGVLRLICSCREEVTEERREMIGRLCSLLTHAVARRVEHARIVETQVNSQGEISPLSSSRILVRSFLPLVFFPPQEFSFVRSCPWFSFLSLASHILPRRATGNTPQEEMRALLERESTDLLRRLTADSREWTKGVLKRERRRRKRGLGWKENERDRGITEHFAAACSALTNAVGQKLIDLFGCEFARVLLVDSTTYQPIYLRSWDRAGGEAAQSERERVRERERLSIAIARHTIHSEAEVHIENESGFLSFDARLSLHPRDGIGTSEEESELHGRESGGYDERRDVAVRKKKRLMKGMTMGERGRGKEEREERGGKGALPFVNMLSVPVFSLRKYSSREPLSSNSAHVPLAVIQVANRLNVNHSLPLSPIPRGKAVKGPSPSSLSLPFSSSFTAQDRISLRSIATQLRDTLDRSLSIRRLDHTLTSALEMRSAVRSWLSELNRDDRESSKRGEPRKEKMTVRNTTGTKKGTEKGKESTTISNDADSPLTLSLSRLCRLVHGALPRVFHCANAALFLGSRETGEIWQMDVDGSEKRKKNWAENSFDERGKEMEREREYESSNDESEGARHESMRGPHAHPSRFSSSVGVVGRVFNTGQSENVAFLRNHDLFHPEIDEGSDIQIHNALYASISLSLSPASPWSSRSHAHSGGGRSPDGSLPSTFTSGAEGREPKRTKEKRYFEHAREHRRKEVFGVIQLANKIDCPSFSAMDQEMLEMLGDGVALFLSRSRLLYELNTERASLSERVTEMKATLSQSQQTNSQLSGIVRGVLSMLPTPSNATATRVRERRAGEESHRSKDRNPTRDTIADLDIVRDEYHPERNEPYPPVPFPLPSFSSLRSPSSVKVCRKQACRVLSSLFEAVRRASRESLGARGCTIYLSDRDGSVGRVYDSNEAGGGAERKEALERIVKDMMRGGSEQRKEEGNRGQERSRRAAQIDLKANRDLSRCLSEREGGKGNVQRGSTVVSKEKTCLYVRSNWKGKKWHRHSSPSYLIISLSLSPILLYSLSLSLSGNMSFICFASFSPFHLPGTFENLCMSQGKSSGHLGRSQRKRAVLRRKGLYLWSHQIPFFVSNISHNKGP